MFWWTAVRNIYSTVIFLQVPDDLIELGPQVLTVGQQVYTTQSVSLDFAKVANILPYLEASNTIPIDTAKVMLEQANKNSTVILHNETLKKVMSSNIDCPKLIKDAIVNSVKEHANRLIVTSAVCGAIQLIISYVNLKKLFDAIKDAEIVCESSRQRFEDISQKINNVRGCLSDFNAIFEELNVDNITDRAVARLSNKVSRVKSNIERKLRTILQEISKCQG